MRRWRERLAAFEFRRRDLQIGHGLVVVALRRRDRRVALAALGGFASQRVVPISTARLRAVLEWRRLDADGQPSPWRMPVSRARDE